MKILITGGFGYVGGRLARHLASAGHEVFIGSRTFQPKPSWLVKGSIIVMDWGDERSLLNACKNINVIIHAAGMNAEECQENPELALKVNGVATESLVWAASKQLVSQFIYLSSAHVYTDDLSGVISENHSLTNMHPYAISQVAGEQATINSHSNIAMQTVVVRLANAIGAPLAKDVNCWMLVVNDLCKQAALDRRLVIRGPSSRVRNFITMTDVCMSLEFLVANRQDRLHPLICNMGDKTKTIGNIASAIKSIYLEEKGMDLEIIELSKDRPETRNLDFRSSVLADIGYQWSSNFKEELIELVKFCEFEFSAQNAN
ncbi:SDR family oxidoreductase [Alphaproteobacteria bacterium]|nr:SDR family oxidoreductase [Alphaproteobacteria bacterium]